MKLPLYLTYVEQFNIIPQGDLPRGQRSAPDLIRGMYILRRACRADGSPMGAIVPLYHIRQPVQLVLSGTVFPDLLLIRRVSKWVSKDGWGDGCEERLVD